MPVFFIDSLCFNYKTKLLNALIIYGYKGACIDLENNNLYQDYMEGTFSEKKFQNLQEYMIDELYRLFSYYLKFHPMKVCFINHSPDEVYAYTQFMYDKEKISKECYDTIIGKLKKYFSCSANGRMLNFIVITGIIKNSAAKSLYIELSKYIMKNKAGNYYTISTYQSTGYHAIILPISSVVEQVNSAIKEYINKDPGKFLKQ